MSVLIKGSSITKLSQLQIDTDKNWNGKGISNVKQIAGGMTTGHIVQHNGLILETLPPGPESYVLTSAGPGQRIVWAPGGTYLYRYFPVTIEISRQSETPFNPDKIYEKLAPLTVPCGIEDVFNSSWFVRHELEIVTSILAEGFNPHHWRVKTPILADNLIQVNLPVSGAIAEAGGTQTDETAGAKSPILIDQQYAAQDDGQQGFSNSSYWEAQTFTTALAQRARGVWLKIYRTSGGTDPGPVTVSLKETDENNHPTGVDLCIATFPGSEVPFLGSGEANWLWVPFNTAPWLTTATRYALVVRCATSGLYWRSDNSSPTYTEGNREYSTNAGTSWTTDTGKNYMFKVGYTLDDMNLLPSVLETGDAYYWGYNRPFERLLQDISAAAGGDYSLAWEYSRGEGAWAACIDLLDNTNRFQNYGLNIIAHTPQVDWAPESIQEKNLYWLRARCTGPGTDYISPRAGYARISKDY
ncbi:hypothetical protein B1778_00770 [Dehalococcoides mccartyi]|uniref:hypothetical protein n=1 Tax=Dehalococcoides mccartyi TaxID=61435 RepID=UPI00098FD0E1|nr:hypothetical protein [Dehalococcoides mccartyi]AQU05305.1 hypothetical protein B1777_00915 [Dehalococcoides mccartyi]AQU06758.1 hypothetical protein B1778_00770 [Dehalococcoides mccartyi]